ncbi:MAG: hypothetical protein NC320_10140 [Clostridium sp.]|nr:hypothetical protein [Clostridium sp.]MCM1548048.1 hypothetical protein [Ruminococcus sp.]
MENKKSALKLVLEVVISAVCIFIICIVGLYLLIAWSFSGTTYHIFTKKRTAEMEDTFKIKVTDNIKLDEYNQGAGITNDDVSLKIIVYDYREFLEDNICGTIENYEEHDDEGGRLNASFEYSGVKAEVYQRVKDGCYHAFLECHF